MADSLLNIKKRMATVKSIKKITNAMKLIASSRYNKIKVLFDNNMEYYEASHKAMQTCLKYVQYEDKLPSCLTKYNTNKKLYILITPTLGLCGSYYYNLEKVAKTLLNKDVDAIFIGEKGYRAYKNKVNKAYDNFVDLLDNLTFGNVNLFRHWMDSIYRQEQYNSITIIYTKYINSMNTKATSEILFPIDKDQEITDVTGVEPKFEGNANDVMDLIVPHYIDALLYRYLLESSLSEQTCRKNSMENATESANQLIDSLTLIYNKVRQQNITNELTEIISGSVDPLSLI